MRRIPSQLVLFLVLAVGKQLAIRDQFGGTTRGLRFLFASFAVFLIVSLFAARKEGRAQAVRLLGIDLVSTLIVWADILHVRGFGTLPTVSSLRYADQLTEIGPAVIDLIRPADLLLLLTLPAHLAFFFPQISRPIARRKLAAGVLAGIALLAVTMATSRGLRQRFKGNAFVASDLGFASYHLVDLADFVRQELGGLSGEKSTKARDILSALAAHDVEPRSTLFGAAAGLNVIVIQLESWSAWPVGLSIDGQPITPNFDALAKESLHFTNYFHQAAGGRTSDAQFVSNCSLYPAREGAAVFSYARNQFRCLPWQLRSDGYHTALYQPLNAEFWNSATFDPKLGFTAVHSGRDFVLDETIGLGLSDRSMFRQMAEKLETLEQPYYAFMLTVTSHNPFDFAKLPRSLELGGREGTRVGHYLHAIHYTDAALGAFVEDLRTRGILDRSVLVVYGDHEGLTRRTAKLQDVLPFADSDEPSWFREEHRVPLAIRLPGGEHAGEQDVIGSQLDLAPTLLGLLGRTRGEAPLFGSDLLAPTNDRIVSFVNGSVITQDRLFLSAGAAMGAARCFGPSGETAAKNCADLESRAAPALAASQALLDRNLVPELESLNRLATNAPGGEAQAGEPDAPLPNGEPTG